MIQKHAAIKEFKERIFHFRNSQAFLSNFLKNWRGLIASLEVIAFLRAKHKVNASIIIQAFKNIKESLKMRFIQAFQKQVRRTAIFRTLRGFKMRGETPFHRSLHEAKILLNFRFGKHRKYLNVRARSIVVEIIRQSSVMILLEKRLEIYTLNGEIPFSALNSYVLVIKIQKKWKNLKLRKMMYKATIRNLWNKNMTQFFFLIKKERMNEKQTAQNNEPSPVLSPVNLSPANAIQGFILLS